MANQQQEKPQINKFYGDKPYSTRDTEPNIDLHYSLQMDNVIIM